jgi:hypothetical protein
MRVRFPPPASLPKVQGAYAMDFRQGLPPVNS